MIELVEDKLDIDTYLELRQSVNFRKLTRDQAKKGLSNSMYTLVAFKDGKAVGMGRIVGDGAIICYVQDLIIRPEVQGEGIGGLILETLKKFVAFAELLNCNVKMAVSYENVFRKIESSLTNRPLKIN